MAVVLLVKPAGLFGKDRSRWRAGARRRATAGSRSRTTSLRRTAVMAALLAIAPFLGVYPVFLMKALCFALFACAFNLLIGYGGLLSFGHAMFLGPPGT